MGGFCRTMSNEPDLIIRNDMLDSVINLLDDSQDSVKAMLFFYAGCNRVK